MKVAIIGAGACLDGRAHPSEGSHTSAVTVDRSALLRDFYLAIDRKDWSLAASYLAPDCTWHILANDVTDAASAVGPAAVSEWFVAALGAVQTRQIIENVAHRGNGAAVFTTATVTVNGVASTSEWIDVFTFTGDLIAEHVSVQTG
ncbi:MAG: SnoaL-like domain [Frankiales bacterium]|nr:SnoaL-like domain [Frankiales bacterium]